MWNMHVCNITCVKLELQSEVWKYARHAIVGIRTIIFIINIDYVIFLFV